MKNPRSRDWFQTPEYYGLARRAWLRSEGFPRDIFDGKPVVGICNSWSELNNCNAHLREVACAVKRGVWAGRSASRVSDHLAWRNVHEADDDALPQPDGDGRGGVNPGESD